MALFSTHMTASEKRKKQNQWSRNQKAILHSQDASTTDMKVFFMMPLFIQLIKPKGKKTIGNSMLPFQDLISSTILTKNSKASLAAQRLKRLPVMQETWVRSLGWEDPLEKKMATHSSILAWRIPWTEERGGLQSDTTERLHFHFHSY